MCSHCLFALPHSYSSCRRFGRIINRTQMAINFMWLHLVSHRFQCWLYGRIMRESWCQSLPVNATAHLSRWLNSIKEMRRETCWQKDREDRASFNDEDEENDVDRDVKRKAWIMTVLWSRTPLKNLGFVQERIKSASGSLNQKKIPRYVSLTIMMFNSFILVRKSWL